MYVPLSTPILVRLSTLAELKKGKDIIIVVILTSSIEYVGGGESYQMI